MQHLPIANRARRFDAPPRLVPRRHDAMELIFASINSFHHTDLPQTQQQAIQNLGVWYRRWQPHVNHTQPMREAIKLLSDVFFLGQLEIDFEWDENVHRPERRGGHGAYGITPYEDSHRSTCVILTPRGFQRERGMANRKVAVFSSLIHECCHAFLYKFACIEECRSADCSNETLRTIGMTGHASAWFLLAAFVQTFARREFQLDVNLEIFHGALEEYNATAQLPGDGDWIYLQTQLSMDEFGDLLCELEGMRTWLGIQTAYIACGTGHIAATLLAKARQVGKVLGSNTMG